MAVTVEMRTQVSQLYVALFGRAPDAEGLGFWVQKLADGVSLVEVANAMYDTAPARSYYPGFLTNGEIIESFYQNVLGRPADDEGLAFWTAKLNAPDATPGSVLAEMIDVVVNYDGTDPDGLTSAALFENKVQVAQWYGETIGKIDGSTEILSGVTNDPASVEAVKAGAVDTGEDQTFTLTTGLDELTGTAGDDVFEAKVVQNVNGEQTNQLATGDAIDGGAGTDTLNATVQAASSLNGVLSAAIAPETVDVEVANFTALPASQYGSGLVYPGELPGGGLLGADVVINAKFMDGLDKVGSIQSDATLVVQNLNTLTDSGVYEERRNTEEVTIRFDHGSNNSIDGAADMVALFDNDYLVSGQSSLSEAMYYLLDEKAELAGNPNRLANIDVNGLIFEIDGEQFILASEDARTAGTHEGFVAALQLELAARQAAGEIPESVSISLDPTQTDITGLDDLSASGPIPAIVVSSTDGILTATGFAKPANLTGEYDVYGVFEANFSDEQDPITATVELLKVGRGGEGGELIIGGMATDLQNNLDFTDNALQEGVEVFNVTVEGDQTQFSSLAGLHSTNNTLAEVNVAWAEGSLADLIIGNQNTVGGYNNALKDVRDFSAVNNNNVVLPNQTVVTNDVTLWAHVSDEAVAKYMDLTDDGADPFMDNANFNYSFGAGNDTLNLNISKANLAQSGTANREDFTLDIVTSAGDDTVVTQIGDGIGDAAAAWYINNSIQKNLSIDTGLGDDSVHTNGAGTWNISAGAGDDVVYSDNSGRQDRFSVGGTYNDGRAVWVLNTANQAQVGTFVAEQNIDDLVSAAGASTVSRVANLQLQVSYLGLDVQVNVGDTFGESGQVVTDLVINQAIKDAINNDIYLSKLLVAEDGPGRTLVISSLTDGTFTDADIDVSLFGGVATGVQVAAGAVTFTDAMAAGLGFDTGVAGEYAAVAAGRFDSALADEAGFQATGADSAQATASTIDAGAGQDVIVLSTSGLDTEIVNVADGEQDVVFNVTNALVTVDLLDVIVTGDGQIFGSLEGDWDVVTGTVALAGSAGRNVILGDASDITGTVGDDTILGSLGDDTITGAAGADTLTGNAGADTFVFATGDAGITLATADTITDFTTGEDTINVGLAGTAEAAPIVDGSTWAAGTDSGLASFITAADAALTGSAVGNGIYVAWNVAGTGNAYAVVDHNDSGIVDAGDSLIVLTGVSTAGDIAVADFVV